MSVSYSRNDRVTLPVHNTPKTHKTINITNYHKGKLNLTISKAGHYTHNLSYSIEKGPFQCSSVYSHVVYY